MRCNPSRWLWGLIPIAMLSWGTYQRERFTIEADVAERSTAALKEQGQKWASVTFDGRDAVVTGRATKDGQPKAALDAVRSVWGVRRVELKTDLAAEPSLRPAIGPLASEEAAAKAKAKAAAKAKAEAEARAAAAAEKARKEADELAAQQEKARKEAEAAAQQEKVRKEAEAAAQQEKVRKEAEAAAQQEKARKEAEAAAQQEKARKEAEAAAQQDKARKETEAAAQQDKARKDAEAAAQKEKARKEAEVAAAAAAKISHLSRETSNETKACESRLAEAAKNGTIRFERAKSDIDPASSLTIARIAEIVKSCPGTRIEVEGHTDSEGEPERNQNLSERRARAVVRSLEFAGVPAARLTAVGYGAGRPIADNSTPENMALNRRIEFKVFTK